LDDGRYLLQLRDNKSGIFFPGHWGLFGGGIESEEEPEAGLVRELMEELGIQVANMCLLTRFEFDLTPIGFKKIYRVFYEVQLPVSVLNSITLGEGAAFKAFTKNEILTLPRLTPYDGFALWFHSNKSRLYS